MTYKDLFVAEVKLNGKILRVRDNNVYLPFGSEYSILLKNLNSRRASIQVSIDGQDVLDNHSLILDPKETTELEGFLRGSTAKNRFKFINKTKEIQDHRGDKVDDGLIRIEFAFEKPLPEPMIKSVIKEVHHHYNPPFTLTYRNDDPVWSHYDSFTTNGGGTDNSKACGSDSVPVSVYACASAAPSSKAPDSMVRNVAVENSTPLAEEGITVKGSECNQAFNYTSIGQLEKSEVIIFQLMGLTETGNDIKDPITMQKKFVCSSCGKKSKSSFKFCPNCGTFLE